MELQITSMPDVKTTCNNLGMRHEWCRIVSLFGPFDGEYTLISSLIASLKKGEKFKTTKCDQIWDYIYSKDAARAFYETEEETHEYLPDYGKYDRNQMRKMTHLEYFKLTDTYILFDYQNRNPLNQEARVCKIEKIKL